MWSLIMTADASSRLYSPIAVSMSSQKTADWNETGSAFDAATASSMLS